MIQTNSHGRFTKYGRYLACFSIILLALFASGCSHTPPCAEYVGGRYDLCLLRLHGIPVLRSGQIVTIILPSEHLFVNDTSEISENYKPYLSVVANFIRSFSTISVEVAGYTEKPDVTVKTKGESIEQSLSREQAEAVVRYLTMCDINARLLYAVGRNGLSPIAWTGTAIDRSLNRRIEITFQYYKDNTAWY